MKFAMKRGLGVAAITRNTFRRRLGVLFNFGRRCLVWAVVFGAVATVTDASGVHEMQPHTDEEWTNVLNAAVMLGYGS